MSADRLTPTPLLGNVWAMTSLELQNLLAIEHSGWQALTDGSGADFYEALMAEDGLMVLVGGMVLTRDEVIDSLKEAEPWARYDITGQQLIPIDEHCATLVYRASALRPGEDTFRAIMASTYRLVRGQLRLMLYQQTHITT